jgi:hypothetical protein
MRVISLTDGTVCYLRPALAPKFAPPAQAYALAKVRGYDEFPVQLPADWSAMNELELRQLVDGQRPIGARDTTADRARGAPSPPRESTRGDHLER